MKYKLAMESKAIKLSFANNIPKISFSFSLIWSVRPIGRRFIPQTEFCPNTLKFGQLAQIPLKRRQPLQYAEFFGFHLFAAGSGFVGHGSVN